MPGNPAAEESRREGQENALNHPVKPALGAVALGTARFPRAFPLLPTSNQDPFPGQFKPRNTLGVVED